MIRERCKLIMISIYIGINTLCCLNPCLSDNNVDMVNVDIVRKHLKIAWHNRSTCVKQIGTTIIFFFADPCYNSELTLIYE